MPIQKPLIFTQEDLKKEIVHRSCSDFHIYGNIIADTLDFYFPEQIVYSMQNDSYFKLKHSNSITGFDISGDGTIWCSFEFFRNFPDLITDFNNAYNQYLNTKKTVTGAQAVFKVNGQVVAQYDKCSYSNTEPECDCGAKHTSNPDHHLDWCSTLKTQIDMTPFEVIGSVANNLDVATGDQLEQLAKLYGLERENDTDVELRTKLLRHIKTDIAFKKKFGII